MIFYFINDSFLYKLKTSLETCFLQHDSYIFLADRLYKGEQNLSKDTDYTPWLFKFYKVFWDDTEFKTYNRKTQN